MKKQLTKAVEDRLLFILKVIIEKKINIIGGDDWGFNGNWFQYCNDGSKLSIEKLTEVEVIGILLHEVAHYKYTKKIDIDLGKGFIDFLDSLEDIRVENLLCKNNPGTFDNFKAYNKYLINKIDKKNILKVSNQANFLLNLRRVNWGKKLMFKNKFVEDIYKEMADKLICIRDIKSINSLYKYTKDNLWDIYKKLIEEIKSSGSMSKITNELRKDINSNEKKFINTVKSKDNGNINSEIKTKNSDYKTYNELYKKIQKYIHCFSGKLKSILNDNNNTRYSGSFKKGKLSHKKTYKYKCSNRIFSQKTQRMNRLYNVVLLVDESSSMRYRDSIYDTALSSVLIGEVLNKIGIDFAIYGFNITVRQYKKFSDNYDSVKTKLENIIIETYSKNSKKTHSGMALNYARHSLRNRTGKNIIIMLTDGLDNCVGIPLPIDYKKMVRGTVDYRKENTTDFSVKNEILKLKNKCVLVGVGIGKNGNYVKDVFPNHVLIDDITELYKELYKILKIIIKRK